MFFDSAYKKNSWVIRGGGILINPEGETKIKFEWGLGHIWNNLAEMYGLFLGLQLTKKQYIPSIIILRDSLIIIQILQMSSFPKNNQLALLLWRIFGILDTFSHKSFFHILHSQNKEAYLQANIACQVEEGQYEVNSSTNWMVIPWWAPIRSKGDRKPPFPSKK